MAFAFSDSQETYLPADIAKAWSSVAAGGVFVTEVQTLVCPSSIPLPPGPGAQVLTMSNGSKYPIISVPAQQTYIACGWFYLTTNPLTNVLIAFLDNGTEHVSIRGNGAGKLTLTRNSTVLATSLASITLNAWNHIGLVAKIDDATGTYDVYLNNVNIITGTGADTRNGGNATANGIGFGSGTASANTTYLKHQVVLDTTGSVSNSWPGMAVVAPLRPVSAGAHTAWTSNAGSNFGAVGDVFADADLSFIQSATPGQIDTYGLSDLIPATATIIGVEHRIMAKQSAGTARQIAPVDRISGTDYVGTTVSLGASYVDYLIPETVSPATSGAYSVAEINAMEAGVKEIA